MILNALAGKALPVYGKGDQVRDWLFVEDHCDALMCVLESGIPGDSYNIGGNCEKTNLDLIACIYDELKLMHPGLLSRSLDDYISFVEDRLGHDRRYAIDASKINKELGWEPSVTFEQGLSITIDWFLENKEWLENVTSGLYQEYYNKQYK